MKLDRLAKFAWGVLAYNLFVIVWGAFVRATGSGAGCGSHWPLCNGEAIPRAPEIETIIEFTHRATSGLALLAVVVLFVWARRAYPSGHIIRRGAALSLFFIIVEALLGAGLVLFELVADDDSSARAFSMVAHLLNTFVLLAVLTLTAWWASGGASFRVVGSERTSRLLIAGALGILLVGATGAIAALGDTLFPATTLGEGLRDSFASTSHPLIQLRKYHPFLAILVGLGIVAIARQLSRSARSDTVRKLAMAVTGLYILQLIGGTVNMILLAPVAMQLFHLLLADLLWIAYVIFAAALLAERGDHRIAAPAGRSGAARLPADAGA
jgi:heme A synthase